jgi:hypothetical protein
MANGDLRSRVEGMLREIGVENLVTDPTGGWPIRRGSAVCVVRIVKPQPPLPRLVQIVSPLVTGVSVSPQLLAALNDINLQIPVARVAWGGDAIVVAAEVVADTLDREELGAALEVVSRLADTYDEQLQAMFGGELAGRAWAPAAADAGTPSQRAVAEEMGKRQMLNDQIIRTLGIQANPLDPGAYRPTL